MLGRFSRLASPSLLSSLSTPTASSYCFKTLPAASSSLSPSRPFSSSSSLFSPNRKKKEVDATIDWKPTPSISKHPVRVDPSHETKVHETYADQVHPEPPVLGVTGRERAVSMERAMGEIRSDMAWINAYTSHPIERYRVMGLDGEILDGATDPQVGKVMALKMYQDMLRLNVMDGYLYDVQRQGRISFYMTNFGEEASHIGSAAALESNDEIFGQYRESGVLMWRGFSIQQFMDQCYSNLDDLGKGKQMPVHYGSRDLHFQTISSPLSTQIPQASGYAYALKHSHPNNCVVCYFGDGAASEGDFHAALNSAATLDCPVIFFCRNNQYAISTSVDEQYRGDGIASRGTGYGMDAIRVDGNDVWAVYNVVKHARRVCVEESRPVLIEAMSYRIGHHSTSDDSTRYRSLEEIEFWREENDPIMRFRRYMIKKGWWSEEEDVEFRRAESKTIIECLKKAESKTKPHRDNLFEDVYEDIPQHLLEQREELNEFLKEYGQYYKLNQFTSVRRD